MVCLESKDFVQIRNSLIVLTKIIQHFPVIQNLATVIEKRVDKVSTQTFLIDYQTEIFNFFRFVRKRRIKDKICTSRQEVIKDN